jgi:hypothetical protein
VAKEYSKEGMIQFSTFNVAKNDLAFNIKKAPAFYCLVKNHKTEGPLKIEETLSYKDMKDLVERALHFSEE